MKIWLLTVTGRQLMAVSCLVGYGLFICIFQGSVISGAYSCHWDSF